MHAGKYGMLLLCGVLAVTAAPAAAQPKAGTATRSSATGELLSPGTGLYPSSVRLEHAGDANGTILVSTISFGPDGGFAPIFRSTDEGKTFTEISQISDPAFATGLCCGSMIELPQPVGALPEGTLLWTASVGADAGEERRMHMPVWQSQDQGQTWSYLSTCAVAMSAGGLWEPELAVDAAGGLGCYFADENFSSTHSQLIHRVSSADGLTWGPPEPIVASPEHGHRPGMPVIRRLPDGRYYMSYEICGTGDAFDCAAYVRMSDDGINWGDPADLGALLSLSDGRFFAHAPKITVINDGTPDGRVITVGQELKFSDGTVAPGNGITLFGTDEPGVGGSVELPAPVQVPGARNEPCPNYSSSLVPLADPARILEIATDYDIDGVCKAYFATGAIAMPQR